MAEPPLKAGAVHETSIPVVLSAIARTLVGAFGTVRGVYADEVPALPVPARFTAEILNVYIVPFVSPVTVIPATADALCANVEHDELMHDCTT